MIGGILNMKNEHSFTDLLCQFYYDFKNYFSSLDLSNEIVLKNAKNRLEWLINYIGITNDRYYLQKDELPDLKRGNIILAELGFNFGKEFGGRHYCIVLRDSSKANDRVMILPITTKKPSDYEKFKKTLYIEFESLPRMGRLKDNENENGSKRWCNILNIRSISKSRIIYPIGRGIPEIRDSQIKEISRRIVSQVALRNDLYSKEKKYKKLTKENEALKEEIEQLKNMLTK